MICSSACHVKFFASFALLYKEDFNRREKGKKFNDPLFSLDEMKKKERILDIPPNPPILNERLMT